MFQQHCIDEFSWLVRVHGQRCAPWQGRNPSQRDAPCHERGQANPQGVPVLSLNFVPALGKGETLPGGGHGRNLRLRVGQSKIGPLAMNADKPTELINTRLFEH